MTQATLTTPNETQIHVERVFNAPPDVVFATMTDPELIPQWFGPRSIPARVDKMDVRPGGEWRFICTMPDGSEAAFRGSYRELDPPNRIVQTFEFEPVPGESVETMTLEDLGDGRTKISVVAEYGSREARDGMLESGMESGMNETYERLDELLAKAVAA